jgi:thiol:disulfide interchange protein
LPVQLRAGFQTAAQSGLSAYAFFTAQWCENCQEIEKSLEDSSMAYVFRGAYIMRLDLDVWADQARESGMYVVGVPAFYGIGADGRANGRSFIGGSSGKDVAGRSISSLEDFFSGNP